MSDPTTILVADDDAAMRGSVSRTLRREAFRVVEAEDGAIALEHLRRGGIDLLIADLRMPRIDGLELLRAARVVAPETEIILLSGHGTVEEAVAAMKEGAYDFLTKPCDRPALVRVVSQALERRALIVENRRLKQRLEALTATDGMVGSSPAMVAVAALVKQVAPTSATVLILGESGTGKEVLARFLHQLSLRRTAPFVSVNCAALPDTLLESELFGYEKGAFTGAAGRKKGRFEIANGGTLFLDEIADLSLTAQAKLLRVLQEAQFEPLGATHSITADVRIVAATNQDLAQLVREKRFREDLYYRLEVITVRLPALRDRREDIPLLAEHFLHLHATRNRREFDGFTAKALAKLVAHPWPGNVRELEHAVERAVVLARSRLIDVDDLPEAIAQAEASTGTITIRVGMPLEEVKLRLIEETLRSTKGDKELAAKLLGIASRTIYRKLREHDAADRDDETEEPPT